MNSLKVVTYLRAQSIYHGAIVRGLSTANENHENHKCKLLIVGGGAGGCSVAAKMSSKLGAGKVIVLEPSDRHYYQPLFTLIGGGIKKFPKSHRPTASVLPKKAKWIHDAVAQFDPKNNTVYTAKGDKIEYDFMLIGVGLRLDYHKIPGLVEALEIPNGPVCSNFSPKYVERTFAAMQAFKEGNAIFTFPNTSIKCPGAPQKVMYIAEDYFRKTGKRDKANIMYNSSLPVIFGVKHYAGALWEVCKRKGINVNLRTNLVEVTGRNTAIFQNLDTGEKKTFDFEMLHVTPPMSTPEVLSSCKELVNDLGYVDVDKDTMQHVKFDNVFSIGDCSGSPNSKTAASVASQCKVIENNLTAVMDGKKAYCHFNGYASCPLVTSYNSAILAEFDYNLQPLETFPIDQRKESYLMYVMKRDFMAPLYWYLLLNGWWNGPDFYRNMMRFMKKDCA